LPGLVNDGEEYDAAYAATVAAVAYAIAAREDKLLASQEMPAAKFASGNKERLGSQKKRASFDERQRGESLKRPTDEGSKISRWFISGKEPLDDDYDDDEQGGTTRYAI
jgi:hypothetical protein